ncbi:MAG: carboxypeptidase-like regulatory domain-containing protein [Flavobacteriales bacterium]|nr:carboxypeptidase-like regulatory domain-containing protein [Flavobacteriales bacterium]
MQLSDHITKTIFFNKLLLIVFLLVSSFAFGQETAVSGKITDSISGDGVPFANIQFRGTTVGTMSDINGYYSLKSTLSVDSLRISYIGYLPKSVAVKSNVVQVINIPLKESSIKLDVVQIIAGVNPALAIIEGMVENKEANDKSKFDYYEYEVYNKVEFDMYNLPEKMMNNKLLKPFKFMLQNLDTIDGKPYLPFFLIESLSEMYYQKNPELKREIIKGTRIAGTENESVAQFMGDMYQHFNIYSNYILLFGKNFISPAADNGKLFYKYYLTDSTSLGDLWCYKIHFVAKRKQELTFEGDMWIADSSWAIKKATLQITEDANVNFVNDVRIEQEYVLVDNQGWMLGRDNIMMDFNISKKAKRVTGFIGRKTTTYENIKVNKKRSDEFYKIGDEIIVEEGSSDRGDEFWDEARHEELNERQQGIYDMIDTLKTLKAFKVYEGLIFTVMTGYKEFGKFEIGPYHSLVSYNDVEGVRTKIGVRTSNEFSTRTMIDAYTAYGFRDTKVKYGGGVLYFLSKKPRNSIDIHYKNDVEQLGMSNNGMQTDNAFTSIFRTSRNYKLTNIEEYKFAYEIEWLEGFSTRLTMAQRIFNPLGDLVYNFYDEDILSDVDELRTSELSMYIRFAHKEKFVSGEFNRISLGTTSPIIQFDYTVGIKDLLNSKYQYHKFRFNVSDKIRLGAVGNTKFNAEYGKVLGRVPYPLLEMHPGNESYFYDKSSYNLMNYFEFISDEYVSLAVAHHFEGFILNKVPALRKLKWRSVVNAKGVYGKLDSKHQDILLFPNSGVNLAKKPYMEAGVGIENIFKIIRIDAIWRLTYRDHNVGDLEFEDGVGVTNFAIRGNFAFNF